MAWTSLPSQRQPYSVGFSRLRSGSPKAGRRDDGGSILHSNTFDDEVLLALYVSRYGDRRVKDDPSCLVWKTAMCLPVKHWRRRASTLTATAAGVGSHKRCGRDERSPSFKASRLEPSKLYGCTPCRLEDLEQIGIKRRCPPKCK
jgi:hypothetical protein